MLAKSNEEFMVFAVVIAGYPHHTTVLLSSTTAVANMYVVLYYCCTAHIFAQARTQKKKKRHKRHKTKATTAVSTQRITTKTMDENQREENNNASANHQHCSTSRQGRSLIDASNRSNVENLEQKTATCILPTTAVPAPATTTRKPSSASMDFVEEVRNQAKKLLVTKTMLSNQHNDFDFKLKCIQGLIKVNTEIWERCKSQCCSQDAGGPVDSTSDVGKFAILTYNKVRIVKTDDCQDVIMIAIPKLVRMSFGRIPPLPKKLEAVIPFSFPNNDDVFPDYNGYFKKLLLLEDSFLSTCLSIYQKYLESLQIYLGNIEAWCNETMEANLFVNHEVFGIDEERNSSTHCERAGRKHAKLGPVEGISNIDVTFDILKSKRDRRRLQTCLKFLLSM